MDLAEEVSPLAQRNCCAFHQWPSDSTGIGPIPGNESSPYQRGCAWGDQEKQDGL